MNKRSIQMIYLFLFDEEEDNINVSQRIDVNIIVSSNISVF